jgi:cobyrinic acid a,c-diamide synthase
MMKARFLVAATHKSSGKTTVSTGLCKAISERGFFVQPFKKGPDYIDPMWLSAAAGRPCFNLDFNTMAEKEISSTFYQRSAEADVGIIECNKGLFDGLDVAGSDSNAALAKLLDMPVVLVVDTTGITRGIAPLLKGYEQFDPEIEFAGIILNKVGGPRHEEKLRTATEYYSDLTILGSIHRDRLLEINERHLGLTMPNECAASEERIARMRDVVNDGVDIDKLIDLPATRSGVIEFQPPRRQPPASNKVRIGITMDSAFRFYYPDDLEAFAEAGAELVPIDTLSTSELPDIDGLFAGGGFPEIQMKALEGNVSLRRSIRTAVAAGLPVYAECGGLAYLARSLTWGDQRCEMVGAIPGDAVMHERPQGR